MNIWFYNRLQGLNSALLNFVTKKKIPLDNIFRTLTFIIIIRTFLEMLLEKPHSFRFSPDFYMNIIGYIHIYIFWLSVFLTVAILAKLFLKLRVVEALKLILVFSPLILIPPLIDPVLTGGEGGHIFYSFEMNTFLYNYLNCFNPFAEIGTVTRGVRIEVLAAFAGSFYVSFYIFRAGLLRSILFAFSIYTTVFFYGYLPAIYKISGIDFYKLSGEAVTGVTRSHKFFFMYLAPSVLIMTAITGLLYKENNVSLRSSVFSFLYPSRLLFYILLLGLGFIFISHQSGLYPGILNHEDLMRFISAAISITLLFVYAKILNDIYDIEIDKISNRERPIAKGTVPIESAEQTKNVLLLPSLIFALASEVSFIFYWLFIWAAAYVYSATPFRLRRYYPAGHLILSAIGVSLFLAGGALSRSYEVYSAIHQKEIMLYVFLAFFFLSNIKDFKDVEGDKAGGVVNILNYIMFPRTLGVIFISGFTLSLYLVINILDISGISTIAGTLIFLAVSIFFIFRSKNIERIERLLFLSLAFSFYITAIWLYHITGRMP